MISPGYMPASQATPFSFTAVISGGWLEKKDRRVWIEKHVVDASLDDNEALHTKFNTPKENTKRRTFR